MILVSEKWFTITKINNDTFAISELHHWEKVHSFLLVGKKIAFLIDTGLGIYSIKEKVREITDLPIKVITTHVHTDHIGNHHEFDNISVHHAEVEWMMNGIPGLSKDTIIKNLTKGITDKLPSSFDIRKHTVYTGLPNSILNDSDILDAGGRKIRIIHTPGHSPGHISILDLKYRFLFTGDLLYIDSPIYAFYPTTNPKLLLDSLKKISNIKGVTKVYGSHNTLGINPSIFNDVIYAVNYLKSNNLDHWGSGVHNIQNLSFHF